MRTATRAAALLLLATTLLSGCATAKTKAPANVASPTTSAADHTFARLE